MHLYDNNPGIRTAVMELLDNIYLLNSEGIANLTLGVASVAPSKGRVKCRISNLPILKGEPQVSFIADLIGHGEYTLRKLCVALSSLNDLEKKMLLLASPASE